MAIINTKQARELADGELDMKIETLSGTLSRELAKKSTEGTATKTGAIRQLKRTIAMLLTIKNERKRGGAPVNIKENKKR